ncbi:MAG: SsrA-binding protein SmpB [Pseudomonadota bacterium]|nr:SsrA-binding protein SmpB [Pseudomonadota bacterium]
MAKSDVAANRVAAQNRKARHNYQIEDSLEAGLVLLGSEVKALREGRANIAESYAKPENGEIWLINAHIPEYRQAGQLNHEPRRPRKLLLKKREASKLIGATDRDGMTLIPLKLYFNARGIAKLEIGLGKGKHYYDKRETQKKRDWNRQKARLMREKG